MAGFKQRFEAIKKLLCLVGVTLFYQLQVRVHEDRPEELSQLKLEIPG